MRKYLLMCAFVALCAIGVSAQSILLNNPDRRFYLGLSRQHCDSGNIHHA